MIERELQQKIVRAAEKMPVVSVTGPRQSGKTTLVKTAFPDFRYLNFEDPVIRQFAEEDPSTFLRTYGKSVIIDEVQYVPSIFSYIQLAVDEDRTCRFVLTGSQNFLLLQKISQSLAGRVAIFTLMPFSTGELAGTSFETTEYEEYLIKGFYPRIYDQDLIPAEWLNDYIRTYVERDVRQIINIGDLHRFQQFLKLCAGHTGQLVNFSSFGNELGISYHTAQSWLSVLEASYILFRLYPYHVNFNKRVVKSSKLYFFDTGLATFLLGLRSKEELMLHYAKGALFENLVVADVIKTMMNNGLPPLCWFWRDNSGNEIDLVVEEGTSRKAIEIKSGRTIGDGFFKGLEFWKKLTGSTPEDLLLVYGGDESGKRTRGSVVGWRDVNRFLSL
jgi:uncharacterized protein